MSRHHVNIQHLCCIYNNHKETFFRFTVNWQLPPIVGHRLSEALHSLHNALGPRRLRRLQSRHASADALGYVDMLDTSGYIERTVFRTEVNDGGNKCDQRKKEFV
jgi:hypothetical protein